VDDTLEQQQNAPSPLVEVDGEEEYQVWSLEDSRMYWNQLLYLICWSVYDSLTWEPAKFMDGLQAVEEVHQQYPGKRELLDDVLRGPRNKERDIVMAWDMKGGYLGMVSGIRKTLVLWIGGDVN